MDNNFKIGDIIMFTRDIRIDRYGGESSVAIPKMHPCAIVHLNSVHVIVEYKNTKHKLRFIKDRMIPATEMAETIYGN